MQCLMCSRYGFDRKANKLDRPHAQLSRGIARYSSSLVRMESHAKSHLMLTGPFIVAYGLFKTTLEHILWTLSETYVKGTRTPYREIEI